MFRIKVCGVTRPEDASHAVSCGADAIGLNFYPKSPRFLAADRVAEVADACRGALAVGVFVNATPDEIAQTVANARLGAIQLHGDETADFVLQLPIGVPVIRAVRLRPGESLGPIAEDQDRLSESGRAYAAVLVDAAGSAGEYGGTGRTADWEVVSAERDRISPTPLVLAGGLTPANAAEAIRGTGVSGVDTASGVESAPGIKDPALVKSFVETAAEALSER